ncbi:MAG TPA: hypothetical protein VHN98_03720 [Acidimicrobiales bacterium]|nr:hypothetical protein [Acidimicrobiales bacterium]
MPQPIQVLLEVGRRRVFASALDWPGWCRSAKTDEAALDALAEYAPRYAPVAATARVRFPSPSRLPGFDVVERVAGDATTDFGAPGKAGAADAAPLTATHARRLSRLVAAAWEVFDEVAAGAPAALRKGPRGGGRDRDKMVEHVLGAEVAYARKIGIRMRQPAIDDHDGVASLRSAIVDTIAAARSGTPAAEKGWAPRYAARRIAWHVLDHAWEIEDRSVAST